MSTYSSEQILKTTLTIKPSEIQKDINNVIQQKLKDTIEGVCYEDGYVVKGSSEIIRRSPGKIVTHNKLGGIQYVINYKAHIISPSEGDIYKAVISNVNKMGAIAYIQLKESDNEDDSPVIIIIPRDYFQESSWNIEDLNIGQKIMIEVVGTRVKYQSEKIQIVAKPTKNEL
jgi:DNA-directed RNA polymerase subunit E'/Rpb7